MYWSPAGTSAGGHHGNQDVAQDHRGRQPDPNRKGRRSAFRIRNKAAGAEPKPSASTAGAQIGARSRASSFGRLLDQLSLGLGERCSQIALCYIPAPSVGGEQAAAGAQPRESS